jgi:muramoyltetrapeptide carboxypeptidase
MNGMLRNIAPPRLKKGSHLRVIAPSHSLSIISNETRKIADKRLSSLGFTLSYSVNSEDKDEFLSSSIESRIKDLHDAFQDKYVDGIITAIGGHNSVQLLKYIDFELIKNNPKLLMGFSDITTLLNAIYKKTGLISYLGPHYSSWGMLKGFDYTEESFLQSVTEYKPYRLEFSKFWSDDPWYLDQSDREFIKNDNPHVLFTGTTEGRVIGGNLSSFSLLNGTQYQPSLKDSILFIEDDSEISIGEFDRMLQATLLQKDSNKIRAILIGRFQKSVNMTNKLLEKIIMSKMGGRKIPIAYNLNFGHTTPIGTIPIGGFCKIDISNKDVKIDFIEH